MSISVNGINNNYTLPPNINYRGKSYAQEFITRPIETLNNTVDTFIMEPEEEEQKKSHKAAITAGSSVIVLTGLIALLNPKFSSKLIDKLKIAAEKAELKAQNSKNSFVKTKFYNSSQKALTLFSDIFQFTNTLNAAKDQGFKWLCASEKFKGVKNDNLRNILQKCDSACRKVTGKTHDAITDWFDVLSKKTVHANYQKADNKMKNFENLLESYKNKLSVSEQKVLDTKLDEIKNAREFFSKEKINERLVNQEKSMDNLEKDFNNKLINGFCKKFELPSSKDKLKYDYQLLRNNMSYWAEDMLSTTKTTFEKDGRNAVETLMGNGKDVKGKYQEAIDILSPHLEKEERTILENGLKNANKKLNKANKSECTEYFDKKRDLVLGGAPTDILTGIGMVGLSGIAVGTADSKEDRISRALTLGFPAIAGVGTSLALTAMLYSGVQGMLLGSAASFGLSKIGSSTDKIVQKHLASNTEKPAQNQGVNREGVNREVNHA